MTDFPTMTVGIVLFNGDPGLLDQCLASVAREAAAADVDVEVLLFDNASTEPVRPPAGAVVIRCEDNLGFGRACNRIVSQAGGAVTLLLNPDAALGPGSLTPLLEAARAARPGEMLWGGYLCRDGQGQVDAFWHWWSSAEHLLRRPRVAARLPTAGDAPMEVEKLCGGALAGFTSDLRTLGPFDESFFLYGEDADLSLRARAAGYRLVLLPAMVVEHYAAASMAAHSGLVEEARADAALRVVALHQPYFYGLLARLDMVLFTLAGLRHGRSSTSARSRLRRLRQVRRWGLHRTVPPFAPRRSPHE
ncbi:MAG: glycosyltransferase [Candidatus Phosphoribacter sp.]|jgi:N-acetylglucosaminyl-diphospho-decaprenol L-rhamnosyltransferase